MMSPKCNINMEFKALSTYLDANWRETKYGVKNFYVDPGTEMFFWHKMFLINGCISHVLDKQTVKKYPLETRLLTAVSQSIVAHFSNRRSI